MGDWRGKAKKMMQGKWIRFDAETPAWTLTFEGEPQVVEKTAQTGPNKGEAYEQMSFPVSVDGEPKLLEPNRSLLAYIVDEDTQEDIIGRSFIIKCLDLKGKRQWKMTEVAGDKPSWTGKKQPAKEKPQETEEEKEEKQQAEKQKEKEKFKTEVQKRTKARKAKEEQPEPEVEESEEIASREEDSSAETGQAE